MASRVLSLLWGLTFAPGAPAEVAQSRVLSESLHHYLRIDHQAGSPLVWDYMRRCIGQARGFCCDCSPYVEKPLQEHMLLLACAGKAAMSPRRPT
jgi:hypothetical protein